MILHNMLLQEKAGNDQQLVILYSLLSNTSYLFGSFVSQVRVDQTTRLSFTVPVFSSRLSHTAS